MNSAIGSPFAASCFQNASCSGVTWYAELSIITIRTPFTILEYMIGFPPW